MQQVVNLVVQFSIVNFVVHFYLKAREKKFHMVIYHKKHFVMIYIFEFHIFEYTFSNFYILLCLFWAIFIRKQWNFDMNKTKVWRIWKWDVSFLVK